MDKIELGLVEEGTTIVPRKIFEICLLRDRKMILQIRWQLS